MFVLCEVHVLKIIIFFTRTNRSEPNVKRMTKVERSKMEALQSFGADLQDLAVKPKIPKVLEEKLSLKRKLNNH